jgi:hypothetical protein
MVYNGHSSRGEAFDKPCLNECVLAHLQMLFLLMFFQSKSVAYRIVDCSAADKSHAVYRKKPHLPE